MNTPSHSANNEHPRDVLAFLLAQAEQGHKCALVVVMDTQGGAVRAPGALMAVPQDGPIFGYVSGGCIDQDVALRAREALRTGKDSDLVYGAGSPFIDITLPCGGRIDLRVLAEPDLGIARRIVDMLDARRAVNVRYDDYAITLGGDGFEYVPKLRVRVAGRGADPLAFMRLAIGSGIDAELWSHDAASLEEARALAGLEIIRLDTPITPPQHDDDPYTAFILMFHDNDWEVPLLRSALEGDAFYVGAVGSRKTHARRCQNLQAAGVSESCVARVKGPIGLVPSMRDASMLAISTLAEIVGAFHDRENAP